MSIESIEKYTRYLDNSSKFYEYNHNIDEVFVLDYDNTIYSVNQSIDWKYYSVINKDIPVQGWKIHITTNFSDCDAVLDVVSKEMFKRQITFKHLISKRRLFLTYSKNASRLSAGKFITIYPKNINECLLLLDVLFDLTKDFKSGPYILSDRQWKNSNVFYRYGGFKAMLNSSNEYCIYDDEYNLVPDKRFPYFYLPNFVSIPNKLCEVPVQENITKENKLDNYIIEKSLRFSNSGGVYLGIDKATGRKVILKEARSNIGLDGNKKSAEERLNNEYNILQDLIKLDSVVDCYDFFKVWNSSFLVEKYVEGNTLSSYLSKNYPFSDTSTNFYVFQKNIVSILNNLKTILKQIHKQGIFIGDFQTNNIMIDDSLQITLIDFEAAGKIGSESFPGISTIGFSNDSLKTPAEKDWYALLKISTYCFLPIGPVSELDEHLNDVHLGWIKKRFGIKIYNFIVDFQTECLSYIPSLKRRIADNIDIANQTISSNKNVAEFILELRKTLLSNLNFTSERLIKGDIRQYESDCGMLNYLTGGFGAILALYKTGPLTSDIHEWIKNQMQNLLTNNYNQGLLSGITGIAGILYICNYKNFALQLFDNVAHNIDLRKNNISLRSGLSGIGLAFAKLYRREKKTQYLELCIRIAGIIKNKIFNKESLFYTDWDSIPYGLLEGNTGIALFYMEMYKITKKREYLDFSEFLIRKDLEHTKVFALENSLQIFDDRGRYLPYLSNGSIGIYIAIKNFYSIGGHHCFNTELAMIKKLSRTACTFNAGLFNGYSSLIALCDTDHLSSILKVLSLYIVTKNRLLYIPGEFSYRLSLDIYTGVAGVILGLNSANKGDFLDILPVV